MNGWNRLLFWLAVSLCFVGAVMLFWSRDAIWVSIAGSGAALIAVALLVSRRPGGHIA